MGEHWTQSPSGTGRSEMRSHRWDYSKEWTTESPKDCCSRDNIRPVCYRNRREYPLVKRVPPDTANSNTHNIQSNCTNCLQCSLPQSLHRLWRLDNFQSQLRWFLVDAYRLRYLCKHRCLDRNCRPLPTNPTWYPHKPSFPSNSRCPPHHPLNSDTTLRHHHCRRSCRRRLVLHLPGCRRQDL